MKKVGFILIGLSFFVSCQQLKQKKAKTDEPVRIFTVDEIQKNGADFVEKEVQVTGTVSHVCKHSGQRCFLMGSNEDMTIRVEAGTQIGSFNQEQIGLDLKVKGVLHEIRIDEAYVAQMEADDAIAEKDHAIKSDGDGNHEVDGGNHEQEQPDQLAEMRQKIKDSGKGYYSVYYLDGISSEELK